MTLRFSDLVIGSRQERVDSRLRSGELIRVAPGHFIPRSLIDEQTTRWGVRRLLTEARVLSTLLRCGADNPGIAALDAALLLQGVTILNSTPDIHYWREGATVTTHPSVFRSVTVSPHVVVAAEARELRGKPSAPLSPCKTSEPRLTGLAETILDMARFSHPLLAFVNGSLALRELAQYDKFTLAASQKNEPSKPWRRCWGWRTLYHSERTWLVRDT